jgi:hypothetical protein
MKKASKQDYPGAIADYTSAVEAQHAPDDVIAMAIYNRALAFSAIQENEKAANDLDTVLKMPGLAVEVETAARKRRERIRKRSERDERE